MSKLRSVGQWTCLGWLVASSLLCLAAARTHQDAPVEVQTALEALREGASIHESLGGKQLLYTSARRRVRQPADAQLDPETIPEPAEETGEDDDDVEAEAAPAKLVELSHKHADLPAYIRSKMLVVKRMEAQAAELQGDYTKAARLEGLQESLASIGRMLLEIDITISAMADQYGAMPALEDVRSAQLCSDYYDMELIERLGSAEEGDGSG